MRCEIGEADFIGARESHVGLGCFHATCERASSSQQKQSAWHHQPAPKARCVEVARAANCSAALGQRSPVCQSRHSEASSVATHATGSA